MKPNLGHTILGGFVMVVLGVVAISFACDAIDATFFPKHHARVKAEQAAQIAATEREDSAQQAAKADKASQDAAIETEVLDAGMNLYQVRMTAYPKNGSAAFPAFFRAEVAATKRYEAANLAAYGPGWRAKANADWDALGTQAAIRNGMPRRMAEQANDGEDATPHSDDMSPYKEAMDVYYRPSDDTGYDADALRQKLALAAGLADSTDGYTGSPWQEYLRCERSYAIHGGEVSRRPIAKPCEARVDAILAAQSAHTATEDATVAPENGSGAGVQITTGQGTATY